MPCGQIKVLDRDQHIWVIEGGRFVTNNTAKSIRALFSEMPGTDYGCSPPPYVVVIIYLILVSITTTTQVPQLGFIIVIPGSLYGISCSTFFESRIMRLSAIVSHFYKSCQNMTPLRSSNKFHHVFCLFVCLLLTFNSGE